MVSSVEHRREDSPLRRNAPLVVVFVSLLAWSAYAYATVKVNADILAEAIQVQQWMAEPFWVWSYPGQVHGGVVEYPLIALAETIAPGNVYALTLARVIYVPLTGLLIALCFRLAMPARSLWPFAVAAAVGPAVLHGFRMISDIYPSAWLLAAGGTWLISRFMAERSTRVISLPIGGFLIGLGTYQHASAIVLAIPLLAFAAVRWGAAWRQWLLIAFGLVIGLIPMALAMFTQPDKVIVYRPERTGLPDVIGALGLGRGDLAWRSAMLPNGVGVAHADATFLDLGWDVQWWVNVVALVFVVSLVVIGLIGFRRSRIGSASSASQAVAVMWAVAIVMVIALVVVVPPIWYYGTPLGFLFWFSIGFTPLFLSRAVEWGVVGVVLVISAGFSFAQVWNAHPRFLTGIEVKAAQAAEVDQVADAIADSGVPYVFGDYWEVLPIAYASSGRVHPITYNFNRFPLDPAAVGREIVVAVTPGTIALPFGHTEWSQSADSRALVAEVCAPIIDITAKLPMGITAHLCPTSILMAPR